MNPKHIEEAEAQNLELIENATQGSGIKGWYNYKLYRFKACQHTAFLQPTHVRRGHIKCSICSEQVIAEEAAEAGLRVIGPGKNCDWRQYEFIACGHSCEMRVTSARNSRTSQHFCRQCYDERLSKDAENNNMTYLGAALHNKGIFRRYRFNACGHERDAIPSTVEDGGVVCRTCQEERFAEEARSSGISMLGYSSDGDGAYRRYQLGCGCEKDIRLDHVRRNSYSCAECSITYLIQPSWIYLVQFTNENFSWLKLGFTKDIRTRISNYGVIEGSSKQVLMEIPFSTGKIASELESKLHAEFKSFKLAPKDMQYYMKLNGHTECYPIEMKVTLVNRLLEVKNNEQLNI